MRVRVLALLFGLAISLVLAEGGFRVLESIGDDRAFDWRRIDDPVLGRVMPGNKYGHDARGFRNTTAMDRADVVVLGDSQSWGVNVSRSGNWPSQFAALSGQSVYSMAMVGFGPAQYWSQFDQAKALKPALVIVQLYFGNDYLDAQQATYRIDAYRDFRRGTFAPSERVQAGDEIESGWIGPSPRESRSALLRWLFRHAEGERQYQAALAADVPSAAAIPSPRTTLGLSGESARLDITDPVIAEGQRLTLAYLDAIHAKAQGQRWAILLMPAKASVFLPDSETARREQAARETIAAWCAEHQIPCIDPLPAFRAAVSRGEAIYPVSIERHPNAAGYRIVADTVTSHSAARR